MKLNMISAKDLSKFRAKHFLPSVVRERLKKAYPNSLLYSVACGLGKTFCIIALVNDKETWKHYDLIIVTTPQLKTLKELKAKVTAHVPTVVLTGRPASLCGPLDQQWKDLLSQGLNDLGKDLICKSCINLQICEWQKPLKTRLADAKLILTVDAVVQSHPTFFANLDAHIDALGLSRDRVLVINDEGGVYAIPQTVHISKSLLKSQIALLQLIKHADAEVIISVFTDLVKAASTELLRGVDRRKLPLFPPEASRLQKICHKSGEQYALYLLRELKGCREEDLTLQGDTIIACLRPLYGFPYFALGASVDSVACLHTSLEDDIHSPLSHYRVIHPETQFFQIDGRSSTKSYLLKHSHAINRVAEKAFDYALCCYGRNKRVCFTLCNDLLPAFHKAFLLYQNKVGIELFKLYEYTCSFLT